MPLIEIKTEPKKQGNPPVTICREIDKGKNGFLD
jgi:hypothetical protein